MGKDGVADGRRQQPWPRDAHARRRVDPIEGRRLQLTIDYDVQKAAEDGFRALGFNGAAVALDPRTGEVLSLVSLPSYNPNSFASGIDRVDLGRRSTPTSCGRCRTARSRAATRRARRSRSSSRPRRSKKGIVTPDFKVHCPGGATFYGRYFKCHLKGGHGTVDMRHAIEKSCNVYFYTLGNMLGVDRMREVGDAPRPRREVRASTCRTKSKASCRRPPGSVSATTKSGTPARRSPWRSARARCR